MSSLFATPALLVALALGGSTPVEPDDAEANATTPENEIEDEGASDDAPGQAEPELDDQDEPTVTHPPEEGPPPEPLRSKAPLLLAPPPIIAPTAAVAPPPVVAPPKNPRADYKLAAIVSFLGASHGVSLLAEYRPHWIAAFAAGVGGTARMYDQRQLRSAGTVQGEVTILPVPFMITPVVSGGFAVTFGPLAESLPGFAGRPPFRDQWLRLVPYGRFGLRIELPHRLYLEGDIILAPENRFDQGRGTHPLPGMRLGINLR